MTDDTAPTNSNLAAADAPTRGAATTQNNPDLHPAPRADTTFRASRQVTPEAAQEHFAAVAGDADADLIDAKAAVTWRALRYRFPRYERWCEATARMPLPCSAEQLRDYVRQLIAERLSPSSIAVYVSAVATVARLRSSFADRRLVGEHMKAARRRHGPPRRAPPARGADVADVFTLCDPANIRDARDAVVFALGFGLAARASELVGLDLERAGSVERGATGVLQIGAGDIVVRWHRTKAAQEREVELRIPDSDMPEVREWLTRWLALAAIAPGSPLLRPLTKHHTVVPARLSGAAVSSIVRARVEQLEVARGVAPAEARDRAARFSSHSLRRGFCTTAAEAGVPLNMIRQRSRHADDGMVARYVGEAQERSASGLANLLSTKGTRT
jgi:integrase